jgi:hypothetical protein
MGTQCGSNLCNQNNLNLFGPRDHEHLIVDEKELEDY